LKNLGNQCQNKDNDKINENVNIQKSFKKADIINAEIELNIQNKSNVLLIFISFFSMGYFLSALMLS